MHQAFGAAAVLDQIGNGADLQAVFGSKQLEVGQPGHGAVVLHDFADHGAGVAAGHGRQVATRFGVAGAHENAAFNRLKRENVTGLHQVGGHRVGRYRHLHRACAVSSGNAGGYALGRLDGDGERGAHLGAVARHHGRQLQAFAAFFGQREADQPTTETRHEIDRLGRHVFGGEHQVAFVFAVFFVNQDHHATGAHVGHDVGHWGNGHRGQRFRRVHADSLRVI